MAAGVAFATEGWVSVVLALLAAILATVNVAGGFALTHKMLSSFVKKGEKTDE